MKFDLINQGGIFIAMSMVCAASSHAQDIELGKPIVIEQVKAVPSEANASQTTLTQSALPIEASNSQVLPKSILNLAIRSGERLMPTLKKWLADQNVELVWAANAQTAGRVRDVVFEDDFESSAADLNVALTEVLSPFGFEAEISTNSSIRRVTVRNLRSNL